MSVGQIVFYSLMALIVGLGIGALIVGLMELQHDCRTDEQRELKRGHIERLNQQENQKP